MPAIVHGQAVTISPRVRRLTANNGGSMTGPGTNSYLLGNEQMAVVDPGPADPAHIDAILRITEGRLRWVLVTHTHRDHSPAAARLAEATGAQLIGQVLGDDRHQDTSFRPDRTLADNERFVTGEFTLQAIWTPGHVGNHVCYLVEEDRLLLAGDHVMEGSTVAVIPPHGDMAAYLASLEKILDYPIDTLAPAHGDVLGDPPAEVERLIRHRRAREDKVIAALQRIGGASLNALTATVYDDVHPLMHMYARHSLHAHLLKLQNEGRADKRGEHWSLAES